jgi:uncharacterized membrane protein (DUF4010 family)
MPLAGMSLVAGLFIFKDKVMESKGPEPVYDLKLNSPISVAKILSFGALFILIEVGGTLLTRVFGSYGIIATGAFGGLVSSASTTAAAATMAMHGKISPALAGTVTIVSSLASALVTLPIVWKTVANKKLVKKLTVELLLVVGVGVAIVILDRIFQLSELLLKL